MATMVLLLAILLPAPAHAQFFVQAFGGKQVNPDAGLALTQPTLSTSVQFKSVEWDDESFTAPLYYGYGFGYFLGSAPWFGIRAEFKSQAHSQLKLFTAPDLRSFLLRRRRVDLQVSL